MKSSPRSPFMAENKLRAVVSWNPDIFTHDPQFSVVIELANWVQSEIYSRPTRSTKPREDSDSCLLLHVGTLLVWGLYGHMDKELLEVEERKRLKKSRTTVEQENLNSKRVPELRQMLQQQGLPHKGI